MLVIGWRNHLKQSQGEALREPRARTVEFVKYSDWQLNRLRDALRAYHRYGRDHEGRFFNWTDVREAIAEETDIEIGVDPKKGAERLRQFVEGINDKNAPNGKRFPVPQDRWLDAIVIFVTSDDYALLSSNELEEQAPDMQAPLRLLEYLAPSTRDERDQISSHRLTGVYRNCKMEKKEFAVRELTLQNPSDEGLVHAIVTEAFYSPDAELHFDEWSHQQQQDERYTHFKYSGWALMTPEVNLLFFLKDESYQSNHYYFTVASDLDRPTNDPAKILALFHSDQPDKKKSESEESSLKDIAENISAKLSDRLYVFVRHI